MVPQKIGFYFRNDLSGDRLTYRKAVSATDAHSGVTRDEENRDELGSS